MEDMLKLESVKKILFILFIALVGASVGSYTSMKKAKKNASVACINSMLYDLNIELDLLEYWKLKYADDPILEEKIKHLILNKMVAMVTIKPDIERLKGVPLKAIQRIFYFIKSNDLAIKKYDSIYKATTNYFSSIELEVKSTLDKRKDAQKNPFKIYSK